MSENHKYFILGGVVFFWMFMMLVVFCFGDKQEFQPQTRNTFVAFKQKPVPHALIDINTMMPANRLIPTKFYSSLNSSAHRYIKTENSSLYTSNSRLGEGDGEYSGFYRGMLWYNSAFNQYEQR